MTSGSVVSQNSCEMYDDMNIYVRPEMLRAALASARHTHETQTDRCIHMDISETDTHDTQ